MIIINICPGFYTTKWKLVVLLRSGMGRLKADPGKELGPGLGWVFFVELACGF